MVIIHAKRSMIPPGWMSVLKKVVGRHLYSSLMPLALSAMVHLADRGTVRACRVDLTDFEAAFAGLAAPSLAAKVRQGWHHSYHLRGPTPLWGLWRVSSPAMFADLPQSRRVAARPSRRACNTCALKMTSLASSNEPKPGRNSRSSWPRRALQF